MIGRICYGRRDALLLLCAFMFVLVCTYIVALANAYADQDGVNPNWNSTVLLPDVGLKIMGPIYKSLHLPDQLPDYFVYVSLILIFIRIFTLRKRSITVLRRFFFITGLSYLLRAPSVVMTVLPYSYLACVRNPNPNIFAYAFEILLQIKVSCGDVFFSGHSIFVTLSALFFIRYSSAKAWIPVVVFSVTGLCSIVFSYYHYSIDVFFGTLSVCTIFLIYHWIAEGKIMMNAAGDFLRKLDGDQETTVKTFDQV